MSFTSQQSKAIYTLDKNLAVIAGAGSGKTHVLVSRFLHMLEQKPDWPLNAVVAITFTQKAAAEMRDRVREGLEERYHKALKDNEDAQRWQNLLAQMDSARISTIHALCAEVLRSNAAIIQLDPSFQVTEEVTARILLNNTIDAVLNDVSSQDDATFTPLLTTFELYDIRNMLKKSILTGIDLTPVPADVLYAQWTAEYLLDAYTFYEGLRAEMHITFTPDGSVEDKLLEVWLNVEEAIGLILDKQSPPFIGLETMAQVDKPRGGKASNWGDKENLAYAKGLVNQAIDYARNNRFTEEKEQQLADLMARYTQLILRVKTAYQAAKQRDNLLDFDDLERLTCEVLQHESVVMRYRGGEIRHLMVDEFQDTNANQWKIVKALADIHQGGTMFVVGDPKQSIYAFRGADVSVFQAVCDEISNSGAGEQIALSRSFRTHKPLVDSFNGIFSQLLVKDETSPARDFQVELGLAMDAQRETPPNNAPHVELLLIPKTDESDKAESRRIWEAHEIAQRIHQLVKENHPIYDRKMGEKRPVHYGDVAILLRALTGVTLYEDVFKTQGLPYLTLSGRGYYDTPEVWDLRNALQAIYTPADSLALASTLRSPLFTLSDDALFAMRYDAKNTPLLWDNLTQAVQGFNPRIPAEQITRIRFAWDVLRALRAIAGRVTVAELLRELLTLTGYLAILTTLPDGHQRRANVEKLLDKAQKSGRVTLGAFLQYLDEMKTQEVREGEAATLSEGSVNIMTVHASKGLEFPVVILADSSYKGRPQTDSLLLDARYGIGSKLPSPEEKDAYIGFNYRRINTLQSAKDEAESLRLFYVAATRAQDLLIMSGRIKDNSKTGLIEGESGWLQQVLGLSTLPDDTQGMYPLLAPPAPSVHVHQAEQPPQAISLDAEKRFIWPDANLAIPPAAPPLSAPYPVERSQHIRQLAATQIEDVGSAESATQGRAFYRQRFRRQVIHDAPQGIETLSTHHDKQSVKAHQVGSIVHEALRHWHLPHLTKDDQLTRILTAYAWRFGLTDDIQSQIAVMQAKKLLKKFKASPMFKDISAAQKVYREMPFMYRIEDTIINGIIDVVYLDADGHWHIADYKTSRVADRNFALHAQRYYLQLGVYALALQAQLNTVPITAIHYVRYIETVVIGEDDWRRAFGKRGLKERIQWMLSDKESVNDESSG